jgi:general secretion pathway protein D
MMSLSACNDALLKKSELNQTEGMVDTQIAKMKAEQEQVNGLLIQADNAFEQTDYFSAQSYYKQILAIQPAHNRAQDGLRRADLFSQHQAKVNQAINLMGKSEQEDEQAAELLRAVLTENPENQQAAALYQQWVAKVDAKRLASMRAKLKYENPVSLEFRDTEIKIIIEALAKGTGVNFSLDKDVKSRQKASLFVRNVSLEDAISMLVESNGLRMKVLNKNSVIIYPDTARKINQYQDLIVRSFYLEYADPTTVSNLLKNMLGIRQIQTDDRVPMIMIKDIPEVMVLAEKLIKSQDVPEPEVMLEMQIMEVRRTASIDTGVTWPTQLSVITEKNLEDLLSFNKSEIGVSPQLSASFGGSDADVNLLANPRIRVKNKDKAQIHIGDRVPVITSNVSSNGVTSDNVQYIDAGLKLEVEPEVSMSGDVNIKLKLDVSSIGDKVTTNTGASVPQLGTRSTSTQLRLKDGETQVLAGLINDEDRKTITKIPGLGDLPGIGKLFSNHKDEKVKTELVLLITPHIIRSARSPEANTAQYWSGTNLNSGRAFTQPKRSREEVSKMFNPGSTPNATPKQMEQDKSVAPAGLNIQLPPGLASDF